MKKEFKTVILEGEVRNHGMYIYYVDGDDLTNLLEEFDGHYVKLVIMDVVRKDGSDEVD